MGETNRNNDAVTNLKTWFSQIRKEQYEIEHLKRMISNAEAGLLPSGIRYDKDKVQTSPQDTMSKVIAKAVDMQRKRKSSQRLIVLDVKS